MDRLAAMETFVRVIETNSFSAAARLLNIGQPAVSKTVVHLEERLGVRLLIRSTRGLTPTEAGQSFYERAKRTIEAADHADAAARDAGAGLTGRLRVSGAVTFARLHVIPHLASFMAENPGLTIDVVLDDRVIDLVEHGIDVSLRIGAMADSSLTARKIASARRLVIGTPAYFARSGIPQVPADLVGHEAVIYDQVGGGEVWGFAKGLSEVSVRATGRLFVSAAEGVRAAVLADMGVAVSSEWMFAPELASGEVRAVLTDWQLPILDLWAVFPTGRMPSAKARAFAAFVADALKNTYSPTE